MLLQSANLGMALLPLLPLLALAHTRSASESESGDESGTSAGGVDLKDSTDLGEEALSNELLSDEGQTSKEMTRAGTILGTPGFAAPEQLKSTLASKIQV